MSARPLRPLLTLDRGNTTLDCMVHEAGGTSRRRRMAPDDVQALAAFLAGGDRPVAAVGATVVPGGLDAAAQVLESAGIGLLRAGGDLSCPLHLRYEPDELGVDRWVAALAAHEEFGAAVVVDCGTAVTVDLVDRRGTFLGGAIAPGLPALAAGLVARAPGLPPPDADADAAAVPPTGTRAAVTLGVVIGFVGAVERLVEAQEAAAGLSGKCTRVLTGGDAPVLLRHTRISFAHVPDLVHRGLACLFASCS